MPRRDYHVVLNARVVRQDNVSVRSITKQANDGRMSPVQDSNDSAFGTLQAGETSTTLKLHQHVVSMHGVLDGVSRNVHIAIELRDRGIGHHKPIAVRVQDQAALEFIAVGSGGLRTLGNAGGASGLGTSVPVGLSPWQAIPAAGQLFDNAAFFEFGQHFEQRPSIGLPKGQALGNLTSRCGYASKL